MGPNQVFVPPVSADMCSQPRLNPLSQGSKVRNSLQFVVRKLHVEVILQPGKHIQSLKAVDPEGFEKIIIGSEVFARDLELRRCKIEYLFKSAFSI